LLVRLKILEIFAALIVLALNHLIRLPDDVEPFYLMRESVLVHADLALYLIELVLGLYRLLFQYPKYLCHVQGISDPLITFDDLLGRLVKFLEPLLSAHRVILTQLMAGLLRLWPLRWRRGLPHHLRGRCLSDLAPRKGLTLGYCRCRHREEICIGGLLCLRW
jgi:hypothetical protein